MNKKELIFSLTKKDFRVDTFRAGGRGGQYQNKTDSGVRITHVESGIFSESREERSQLQNKKKAFLKLCNNKKFKLWLNQKAFKTEISLEQILEDMMKPENIKIEYYIPTNKGSKL